MCNQTMLLDFMLHTPLNNSDSRHTIYTCTANATTGLNGLSAGTSCLDASTQSEESYEVGRWNVADTTTSVNSLDLTPLNHVKEYMTENCQKPSIFAFSESEKMAIGVYFGGSLQYTDNIDSAVAAVTKILESTDLPQSMALQYCGTSSNYTLGIAVDLNGDLAAVQQYVSAWSDGECVSGFSTSQTVPITLLSSKVATAETSSSVKTNTTLSVRTSRHHSYSHEQTHSHSLHRRSTCTYVQVASGDTCSSLATGCGITLAEIEAYNTACSSPLAVGQYLCCSSGSLPDFAPSAYANGTCYTYNVAAGDTCSALAATYSLTEDEIDSFNTDTWGWYGCNDLQAGQSMCLSNGTAPYPMAIANAVCGPQVPGTNFTGTDGAADWAALNPCPLNACCDIWGECGATPDYCNDTLAASGAPGTAPTGSNGCIFNCGTDIVNDATAPSSYAAVGYFEAYNVERPCLNMDAISIDPSKYTHVHFAFGNITSNFSISVSGQEQQFEYFKELEDMKRIISFGGWDFSTDIDTYMIFREGVAAANRDTLVNNVADFVTSNDLDGVDFDWEYPGEPDIPGIPAGSDEDGSNYLAFIKALRTALPDKSISISVPASYYYLKAFPIAAMAEVVDYIVYMTYDLHGTWDLGSEWSQDGCTAGDCLFSHVNLTETMWALSMLTKAPVATSSIMVGVTSYGRSFEMTTAGCYTSDCTWDAAGAAGPCTDTAGYISNAEINQILEENSSAEQLFSSGDDSDILVYNETQWVAYMTNTTKSTRTAYYKTFNFAGTSEWAIDLEEYQIFYSDGTDSVSTDLSESEAYAKFLDLALDDNINVNYNLYCGNLIPGENTTAELEEYVMLGSFKIDEVLYANRGDPKDWYQRMTSGHSSTSGATCSDFPSSGLCLGLSEQDCNNGDFSDALYWASELAAQLYGSYASWYTAFYDSSFVSSLGISAIATTFTPTKQGKTLSFASFLNGFSTGLGVAASVVPEDDIAVTAFTAGVSNVESIVALLPSSSSFTLPDESDLETALDSLLSELVTATTTAITNITTVIFEYPNQASSLPSSLIDGPFQYPVSNYFYNMKTLFVPDSIAFDNMKQSFNTTIKKYMVGAVLGDGDYYILRDSSTSESDCTDTAKYYIDGSCYTLAYPGASECIAGMGLQATATEDTITSILSYGIEMEELVTNSYTCQNTTGQYFGSLEVDVTDVASTGTLPTCFFNLPVFDLLPQYIADADYKPFDISPCWITDVQNVTVGSDRIVGETYLPDNLATVFDVNYCSCGGAGSSSGLCRRMDVC